MLRTDVKYDRALTVSQAAHAANVGDVTIRRWIQSGRLRARKIDTGTYRIEPSDLMAILRSPEVIAQPMRGEVMGGPR